ncbi:hypothetical protein [Corynebacterium tapiri]|uniref:Uncharacterized protein n=1 Tax=Corynebacterium tapiri TaxID=1448266 RepID=A0A5C4U5S6_9CORY|nr:hypothetical protein [Corynebacterium tapiri]TNL98508.1 hypothetical protein FHE74_04725 [Corynebacterium tapiri]
MTKSLKILAGIIIAGFLVAILGLVALAQRAPVQAALPTGGIERAVAAADDAHLHLTAVSPMDAYGEEFVAAAAVCPRATPESVVEQLGLPSAPEGLPDKVDQDSNYILLIREDGTSAADHISRDRVDLCSGPQVPPFNAVQMLPLAKTEDGGWVLAA